MLRTVVCYSFSHETFIFSGRKSGVWVHLIRACTTGSDPGAPSNHAKHAIFKVWNEGIFFWTWIDRLHFNLQKLDNSLNFGGAWEPVSVIGRFGIRISYEMCHFQRLKWVVNVSKRALWLKDEVLRSNVCCLVWPGMFSFTGSLWGVWVHLIRACTTGSDPGAPSNHAKHAIFKVWNEGIFFWTWIDRLHFNLQKLDNSLNFGGAWEPVSVMQARIK